jgi:hypothetical protein
VLWLALFLLGTLRLGRLGCSLRKRKGRDQRQAGQQAQFEIFHTVGPWLMPSKIAMTTSSVNGKCGGIVG